VVGASSSPSPGTHYRVHGATTAPSAFPRGHGRNPGSSGNRWLLDQRQQMWQTAPRDSQTDFGWISSGSGVLRRLRADQSLPAAPSASVHFAAFPSEPRPIAKSCWWRGAAAGMACHLSRPHREPSACRWNCCLFEWKPRQRHPRLLGKRHIRSGEGGTNPWPRSRFPVRTAIFIGPQGSDGCVVAGTVCRRSLGAADARLSMRRDSFIKLPATGRGGPAIAGLAVGWAA